MAAIDRAKEKLIPDGSAHPDPLADKLREARLRRVIVPMSAACPGV